MLYTLVRILPLLILPAWKQSAALRVDRAVMVVSEQRYDCAPEQVLSLPPAPAGVRTQSVRFELDFILSEQEWLRLQGSRRMPIIFKWFRFSGARMFITSVMQDSNANSSNNFSRNPNGTITYRTQAAHERITSGSWVITPVYADNTPIIINGRELSYQFRVP